MNKKGLFFLLILIFPYVSAFCQDTINAIWKWNKDIEGYKLRYRDVLIQPLIINDVIFFNGSLYPYNITNGKVLKYENSASRKFILENSKDSLVLFNEGVMVFLVNIYNGQILLEVQRKQKLKYPLITTPKIVNLGYCLFLKNDTALVCYDYKKGVETWSFSVPKNAKEMIYMDPIQVNDIAIVATTERILFYNILSGSQIYEISIPSRIVGNMIVSDNKIYYITNDDRCLHAFDIQKREEIWKYSDHGDTSLSGGGMSSKVYIENDILYYANASLVSMNKNTGQLLWKNIASTIDFLYPSQCNYTKKYIITLERIDDSYVIACFNKKNGEKVNYSFGNALFGESNIYSQKHNLFINITRKEGASMKVNAWQIIND